ncbi:MAG: hypothetical protein HYS74_02670 [Parcubacteria group bacterium]|nr:hypothetical protein [Parcubacteria group bacterium]
MPLFILTPTRALIENNYQYGMRLNGAANVSVSDTTIRNHTEKNIGTTAAGVYAENTSVSLSDITFSGNEIDVKGVGSNTISCTNCGSPTTDPADLLP